MNDNDRVSLSGFDHIEFWVGNAKQAAHFYDKALGFTPVARMGLETGCRDRASYVLEQGRVRFVVSSALTPDHEISRHCALHGDGVRAVALECSDVESAMAEVKRRGATVLQPAEVVEDADEGIDAKL